MAGGRPDETFCSTVKKKTYAFLSDVFDFYFFGIVFIYLLSNGNVGKYKNFYMALGGIAGIFAVMDDNECRYWNLVKIDEKWYAVNVHAMPWHGRETGINIC